MVMEKNGGYATLGFLNQHVLKIPGVEWKTKTPYASIRRIVQDSRFFFKIRPGLWALKGWEKRLPESIYPTTFRQRGRAIEFTHTYYQGLIIEIGNLKGFQTFVPAQDKNKDFLRMKLGDVATVKQLYPFTYENVLNKARTVDAIWFNQRRMPDSLFEVEHSGDIQNSLLKFVEIQDFRTGMYIIANNIRQREFQSKLNQSAFRPIQDRVKFLDYDKISEWHSRVHELAAAERSLIA